MSKVKDKKKKDGFAKRLAEKGRSGSLFKLTANMVKIFIMATVGYTVTLLVALNAIPYMSAVVGQSVGITETTAIPDMFAFWILPMAFIVIVLLIAFVWFMYWLWKFITRKFDAMINKRMEQLNSKYGDS